MRTRWLLVGYGALTLVALGVFQYSRYIKRHDVNQGRQPAAQPDGSFGSLSSNPCKNIYTTICQKKKESLDPTGFVREDISGEIQTLRIYEEIIRAHPDWGVEQVDEELVSRIYTPERRSRIEGAFRWVSIAMVRFIERQDDVTLSGPEKAELKSRINRTRLELPYPPAALYSDEPDLYTKNDVFYERLTNGTMRLRVGGAFLFTVQSWFNLIFTVAHELAHAIDPCELRLIRRSLPAFDRLTACFLHQGLILSRQTRVECGPNDQLSETFADWFAVQITGEALKQFAMDYSPPRLMEALSNSVRDLCEQDDGFDESDVSFHPSPAVRIERIFGQHPLIQEFLGCRNNNNSNDDEVVPYCDFNWTMSGE